jgi:hypothetical protein
MGICPGTLICSRGMCSTPKSNMSFISEGSGCILGYKLSHLTLLQRSLSSPGLKRLFDEREIYKSCLVGQIFNLFMIWFMQLIN